MITFYECNAAHLYAYLSHMDTTRSFKWELIDFLIVVWLICISGL